MTQKSDVRRKSFHMIYVWNSCVLFFMKGRKSNWFIIWVFPKLSNYVNFRFDPDMYIGICVEYLRKWCKVFWGDVAIAP